MFRTKQWENSCQNIHRYLFQQDLQKKTRMGIVIGKSQYMPCHILEMMRDVVNTKSVYDSLFISNIVPVY